VTITDEAVLLIAFNRPDHLTVLIDRLREVQPTRVYLAVDGARPSRAGEGELVGACQALAGAIDWPCEVKTLFREQNLGCGLGVSSAISWFFGHEERGVILEDDIIPDPSFFPFCVELLDRYADDSRVFAISGCNFVPPEGLSSTGAYRFTQVPHIWGWATWRRSWDEYQLDIAGWRQRLPIHKLWARSGKRLTATVFWTGTFELLARKQVDTWDGQLVLASMAANQWTATSNVNLVENLGFGADATHTLDEVDTLEVKPIAVPTKPVPVELDRRADAWTRRHHFRMSVIGMLHQLYRFARLRRGSTT
jgi:hypothetical protein